MKKNGFSNSPSAASLVGYIRACYNPYIPEKRMHVASKSCPGKGAGAPHNPKKEGAKKMGKSPQGLCGEARRAVVMTKNHDGWWKCQGLYFALNPSISMGK
jgi:hypothetical protein